MAALGPVPAAVAQLPEGRVRRRAPPGGHQAPARRPRRCSDRVEGAPRDHRQPHPRADRGRRAPTAGRTWRASSPSDDHTPGRSPSQKRAHHALHFAPHRNGDVLRGRGVGSSAPADHGHRGESRRVGRAGRGVPRRLHGHHLRRSRHRPVDPHRRPDGLHDAIARRRCCRARANARLRAGAPLRVVARLGDVAGVRDQPFRPRSHAAAALHVGLLRPVVLPHDRHDGSARAPGRPGDVHPAGDDVGGEPTLRQRPARGARRVRASLHPGEPAPAVTRRDPWSLPRRQDARHARPPGLDLGAHPGHLW